MNLTREQALERIDAQTIKRCHRSMMAWVEDEVGRVGRCLTWDEAFTLLKGKLDLQTDGTFILNEWLESSVVDVASWQVKGFPGVSWGNYATEQDAVDAVERYLDGEEQPYEVVLEGGTP